MTSRRWWVLQFNKSSRLLLLFFNGDLLTQCFCIGHIDKTNHEFCGTREYDIAANFRALPRLLPGQTIDNQQKHLRQPVWSIWKPQTSKVQRRSLVVCIMIMRVCQTWHWLITLLFHVHKLRVEISARKPASLKVFVVFVPTRRQGTEKQKESEELEA
jgi:hypothetical protein